MTDQQNSGVIPVLKCCCFGDVWCFPGFYHASLCRSAKRRPEKCSDFGGRRAYTGAVLPPHSVPGRDFSATGAVTQFLGREEVEEGR
jgi:hypothetical protein